MIVASSTSMRRLVEQAKLYARYNVPLLLCGESGTGKELFAELIHAESNRADQPFVRVNCAALSESLAASELFGHAKGAFTDAHSDREGRFAAGNGGTILLDEIGEIPLVVQSKLLRVIESKEFERVGSSETIQHDARIIAATNRDLNLAVSEGSFRLDLLHRINILQLRLPPLRERREDIEFIAGHFIQQFNHEHQASIMGLTREALELLCQHDWPGNIRQLRNVVIRACIHTSSPLIDSGSIHSAWPESETIALSNESDFPDSWRNKNLEEIERQVILENIRLHGSHRNAAEHLGISPRTLTNKMRKYRQDGRRAA